ncbi:MAG: ABC transporter permease subunit [Verrucomicrobia bacterium]|nr:ABC transporter permease subunit [Verrucomicrobiota bacterium]
MTFLPIVDRELRVAARRKNTYRLRAWTAVIAVGVGLFSLLPVLMTSGSSSAGKAFYTVLTRFAFGLCLLAGALFTADCLSEEKREGTVGLLFLTDLKGYDVVLGKFVAMSLNAFYGLLAILPITGLALLLGGLTGGEFWRTTLALVNALFFSLAAGICVSTFGRDSQRTMLGTLGLVLLVTGGLPLLVKAGLASGVPPACEWLMWISPYRPFAQAMEPMYMFQPWSYWGALGVSQVFGWSLLAVASWALPRRWQERAVMSEPQGGLARWLRRRRVAPAERARAREELLTVNPVLWLVSSGSDFRRIAWMITGAWGVVVLLFVMFAPEEMYGLAISNYGVRPFGFLLKLLLVLQACRFFVEARRNGALEMLLCTPLTSRDILDGQTLALRRSFLGPVVVLLALIFVPAVVQAVTARAWLNQTMGMAIFECFGAGVYCLRMYADCYAITWFGMWLAFTLKKPGLAPALTILFVLLLPSMLCWLDVFADLFFILWGMIKLRQQDLRFLVARSHDFRQAWNSPQANKLRITASTTPTLR